MQKLINLTIVLLLVAVDVMAQTTIAGVVKDEKGAAVAVATVSLLKASDSSWVRSELTGDNGEFSFKEVKQGDYLVNIQAAGYEKLFQPVRMDAKELKLVLKSKSTQLQEVTLTSKAPVIEKGLGKMTLNFAEAANQGDNVLDLLRKSPSVSVANGSITMKGSGVLVLVDDRQTYLSGQDLEDYLKSLPADQVAALELITQPSAKYDAEGGSIINIKTRKIKKRGVNGNISTAYEQNLYNNSHNNANLTYRKDKLTLYANAGYMVATSCLDREDQRKVTDQQTGIISTKTEQTAFMKETFSDANLRLGADYAVNDKATVGGSIKGVYHPNKEGDAAHTVLSDANNSLAYNNTDIEQWLLRKYTQNNAYVKYVPAKDHEITADGDYFYRNQQGGELVLSKNYNSNQQPTTDQNLRDHKSSKIEAMVGKADYSGKLSKDCKIEAGIKCSYANLDKDDQFEKEAGGNWGHDSTRSNHFVYKENINAAYVNANKAFGERWNTQLGVRVENTVSNGDQITQNKQFNNNYTSVFPTAFVSYKIDDKNSVELSCGRRIERPSYTMLDPFINYFTQYFYHSGNPNLLPTYRTYLDVNHNYDNKLITSFGCGKVKGYITPVQQYVGNTNAIFATWGNYCDKFVANGSVVFNKQLVNWWTLEMVGAAYYNKFFGANSDRLLAESLGFSYNLNQQVTFKHGWGIDTTFFCSTGDLQNLIDRYGPNYWLGFNVTKKVLKDTGTIRLSIDDPFRMYNPNSVSNFNGIETASSLRFNSQGIGLGFTYKFGKSESAQQRQSNTEEAGRM